MKLPWFLGAFALVAALAAAAFVLTRDDDDPVPVAPVIVQQTATPSATSTPSPTATPSATPTATPTPTPEPTATPAPFNGSVGRLKIPRFNVDSAIEAIGILPNNQLDVPHNPYNTGWYYIYDKPGFGGNAVFAAHVDYWPNIIGPFYNLSQLLEDDEIVVVMENGLEYTYRVFFKQRYSVETIPMGDLVLAPDKPEGAEWVTLITCGGQLVQGPQGGEYLERDVVIAERIS
jgi:sortase (surface protein transpeptidase)